MLKIKDNVDLRELEKFGFKYGAKDKFLYKTTRYGTEHKIYIDLLPCHSNGHEIKIDCPSYSIPKKITDKLYDLITAGLVEKI